MILVAAGLGDDIDDRPAAASVFRLEVIRQHRDFLNRFEAGRHRHLGIAAVIHNAAAVQVDLRRIERLAVDIEVLIAVIAVLATVNAGVPDRVRTGNHFHQRGPVAPVIGHLRHLLRLNRFGSFARVFHQLLLRRDGDLGRGTRTDLQREFRKRKLLKTVDHQVVQLLLAKSRRLDRERILAGNQRRQVEVTLSVRVHFTSGTRGELHQREMRVDDCRARFIDDASVDSAHAVRKTVDFICDSPKTFWDFVNFITPGSAARQRESRWVAVAARRITAYGTGGFLYRSSIALEISAFVGHWPRRWPA